MTMSENDSREKLPYLSEEELDLLIEETEKSAMISAPSFLKREVFGELRRRRTINQMNCVRMKTWQIVTVVAAAILLPAFRKMAEGLKFLICGIARNKMKRRREERTVWEPGCMRRIFRLVQQSGR